MEDRVKRNNRLLVELIGAGDCTLGKDMDMVQGKGTSVGLLVAPLVSHQVLDRLRWLALLVRSCSLESGKLLWSQSPRLSHNRLEEEL